MNNKAIEVGLIGALGSFYGSNQGETLIFEWKDGTKFEASIVTLSETDNGKELDENGYEEYHACFTVVTKIIQIPSETLEKNYSRFGATIAVNLGIEISYHNAPSYISTKTGTLIWEM